MSVTIIQVPYDSGHFAKRMGRGPLHLVQGGLAGMLERAGHAVRLLEIRLDDEFLTEVGTALETQRLVAECVAAEVAEGRFPLVLSGNCATSVGSVAGAGAATTGVVWLDSHGDFNTPETSRSGFFDGMALAMLVGDCFVAAAAEVPGFSAVAERDVVLVAARDLDAAEEERLERSEIHRIGVGPIRAEGARRALTSALDDMVERVDRIYLHLDLDALDPEVARVNSYQAPEGLTVEEVIEVIAAVGERSKISVAALAAYDPGVDEDGSAGEAALELVEALAGLRP